MVSLNGSSPLSSAVIDNNSANGAYKILLVDDEPNTVQLVRRILQADGHDVYEAFDGEQALEMFGRVHPDLVLLDAVIPKMDGLTVLSEIRKHDKTTGVVMFSALTSELLALQAMQGGADDFVNKPFTLKTLRMHIRRVLDKVYLRQQNDILKQQLVEANEKLRHYMPSPLVKSLMASPSLPRLGGERHMVTVLFLDICGFSTISQKLPPDEVLRVLNDYFAFVNTAVVQHGGMVDKIMGDGFMALFNVPVEHPQHACAAVLAALLIKKSSDKWNLTNRPTLYPRIGIHTGEAVVGNIGTPQHMNYTAIGDTVNLAKRLEENASEGEIWISGETYKCVDASALHVENGHIERMESVVMKGSAKPLDVYRILFAELTNSVTA